MDEDLFDELNRHKWHWVNGGTSAGHAAKTDEKGHALLHRVILGLRNARVFADHRDNNGLDCRRSNLRVASRQQNSINRNKFSGRTGRIFTSRYKGVVNRGKHLSEKSAGQPWLARIRVDGHLVNLGRYATELEAARAYDAAAIQHFGEFARPNFQPEIS